MARNKLDKGVTIIAAHTEMVGDVRFSGQLYVCGKISGNIMASHDKATLIVDKDGFVSGEVHVPNAVINGLVDGNVYVSNKAELAERARVQGNLFYNLIEMQLGAKVEGQLVHDETLARQ